MRRPAAVLAFVLPLLTLLPYAVNATAPPRGTAFLGTFYYVDDFYNYLSYAQQAEAGAFVFVNKAASTPHGPALVNPEWWAVGVVARLLGGGGDALLLAYRAVGTAATVGFVLVAHAWLLRLGVPSSHRFAALLLVCLGGGLGVVQVGLLGRPITDSLDLFTGLYPFVGFLTNPHFTVGTTLFLLALLLVLPGGEEGRGRRTAALVAVGTVLALVRPYDFVLLAALQGLSLLRRGGRRPPLGDLLPLAGFVPVVAYLYWLFYRNPAFAFYASARYDFPSLSAFAWALGPAVLLALAAAGRPAPDERAREARRLLVLWALVVLLVLAVRPVGFSLQFLVGSGFCLLALGACGLDRWRPATALALAAVFSAGFLHVFTFFLSPKPHWLTGQETRALVRALETSCAPGDRLFAPPTVGLFAHGLTSCRSFVSHAISPDHAVRQMEMAAFFKQAPAERRALLDRHGVTRLVLPGDPALTAAAWLGPGTEFRRVSTFGPGLTLYARDRPPAP